VAGAVQDFDLGDVFAALAPRPLLVLNPQDPLTQTTTREEAAAGLAPVRARYDAAGSPEAITIAVEPPNESVPVALQQWLRALSTAQCGAVAKWKDSLDPPTAQDSTRSR
jgi:hypothetical protein